MAQIVAVAASSQHILPPIRKEVDLKPTCFADS